MKEVAHAHETSHLYDAYSISCGGSTAKRKSSLKPGASDAEDDKGDGGKGSRDEGDGAAKVKDGVLGKLLLTASADTTAKVWDVDSRELVAGRGLDLSLRIDAEPAPCSFHSNDA